MPFDQSLAYLSLIVQIAANCTVAAYAFPAWRKHRHAFFLLLAWSALLGVFSCVAGWIFSRTPMSEADSAWIWRGLTVLGSVDFVLYTIGILLLVRHFEGVRKLSTQQPD